MSFQVAKDLIFLCGLTALLRRQQKTKTLANNFSTSAKGDNPFQKVGGTDSKL